MSETKQQCSAKVQRNRRCSRDGVVIEDDKSWCKQHAPSHVKAWEEARDARWEAKWAAQDAAVAKAERIKAAEAAVVEAAVAWREARSPTTLVNYLVVAVDELIDARKAAEKGTAK